MDSPSPPLSQDDEPTVPEAKPELRLWLRLLTCATLIESEVRARLRRHFAVTLPQFDLMAQLDKAPGGLSMGELSRRMMVTNGNVTGIAERLASDGLVTRAPSTTDRRTQMVRLTPAGRRSFRAMARIHEGWIADMLGDLDRSELVALMDGLGHAKASVRAHRERRDGL